MDLKLYVFSLEKDKKKSLKSINSCENTNWLHLRDKQFIYDRHFKSRLKLTNLHRVTTPTLPSVNLNFYINHVYIIFIILHELFRLLIFFISLYI